MDTCVDGCTGRLCSELLARQVALRHVVVNQIVTSISHTEAYVERRRKEQKKVLSLSLSLSLSLFLSLSHTHTGA